MRISFHQGIEEDAGNKIRKESGSGRERERERGRVRVQNRSRANKRMEMSKEEYLYLQQEQKGHKIVQNWDCILLFENINKIYER